MFKGHINRGAPDALRSGDIPLAEDAARACVEAMALALSQEYGDLVSSTDALAWIAHMYDGQGIVADATVIELRPPQHVMAALLALESCRTALDGARCALDEVDDELAGVRAAR